MRAFLKCSFHKFCFKTNFLSTENNGFKAPVYKTNTILRRTGTLDAEGQYVTHGKIANILLKLTAYFHFQKALKTKNTCERV